MHKPSRAVVEDDLPSLNSDNEDDGEEWSSGVEFDDASADEPELSDAPSDSDSISATLRVPKRRKAKPVDSDNEEMPYEVQPRKPRDAWTPESEDAKAVRRLPIKLADGKVKESSNKVLLPREELSEEEELTEDVEQSKIEDVATGARFGRPAVIDVVGHKSRKIRLQAAKEQIASICQEIVADPENSVRIFLLKITYQ
jgi:nucleolar complex protein 3